MSDKNRTGDGNRRVLEEGLYWLRWHRITMLYQSRIAVAHADGKPGLLDQLIYERARTEQLRGLPPDEEVPQEEAHA